MARRLSSGTVVGAYRVLDFLGAGGMGEVYRAVHAHSGRVVALKLLTGAESSPALIERFYNEARIQASLSHPNIAAFYEFLHFESAPCIVMECVEGQTLEERVHALGTLPLSEALVIMAIVAEAVSYIHQQGIVHRDIKSNNVKINTAGEVKLLDFGIARSAGSRQMTATGSVIGTLQYLAPEQIKGESADTLTDLWSLGVLFYEMLTGKLPFQAPTLGALCEKIARAEYQPPSTLNAAVPRAAQAIVAQCLKKNRRARYQSARQLKDDVLQLAKRLNAAPASQSGKPHQPAAPLFAGAVGPLRRWLWPGLAAAGVLLTGGVFLASTGGAPPTPAKLIMTPAAKSTSTGSTSTKSTSDKSTSNGPKLKTIRIDVAEGKAEVWRDGRVVAETPCPIEAPVGTELRLVLKRDGYEDHPLAITVSEGKEFYTEWMTKE